MKDYKYIYFLGIGGIGMSALARYFKAAGKNVSGYDKTQTRLTDELLAEGIDIHFEDDISRVNPGLLADKEETLIVYTPAVPRGHSEYMFFSNNGFNIKKRAEVLGLITMSSYTVAVAGTHGKTTTSSLIAHLLKFAGKDPSAFLGGITRNYNTNLLLASNLDSNGKKMMVVEADEYDRSFLTLQPEIAVITSMDADHLDIYGDKSQVEESFRLFAKQVKSKLVVKKNVAHLVKTNAEIVTYSFSDDTADYYAENVRILDGEYHFDISTKKGPLKDLLLGLPGKHNVENAVAAVAVGLSLGISEDDLRTALRSFRGVKRRFEYHIRSRNLIYIDDYAHHPEELKATIGSAREMFPGKRITGIFQPHLFSRTRDFADEFAASLDMLDECLLLPIYPARELPIEGVSSEMLLSKMHIPGKKVTDRNSIIAALAAHPPEVLITMGAGDIDLLVEPLTSSLIALTE